MNQYSMGLTVITAAVLGIGAVYADLLARRIAAPSRLPETRNGSMTLRKKSPAKRSTKC